MEIKIFSGKEKEVKELEGLMNSIEFQEENEPWLYIKELTGWDRVASDRPVELAVIDDEVFVRYD